MFSLQFYWDNKYTESQPEHVSKAENRQERMKNGASGSGALKNHLSGSGAKSGLNRPLKSAHTNTALI